MPAEELEFGVVVEVNEVRAGSELVEPAAVGATVLELGDAYDFEEDGGQALIGDEVVTYTAADLDETQTLTLAEPLTAAYEVEESVWVYPDSLERRAWVKSDEDGDALDARVPHTLYDHLQLGTRATYGGQERVGVALEGDEWVVSDVLGREPVVDGSYIDPETMPDVEAGPSAPPEASPTLFASGTRDAITLVAEGLVDQYTELTYYMDGDPFTTTRSTVVVVRSTPAGDPLQPDAVYRFKVQAHNALGSAPESVEVEASLNPNIDTQTILATVAAGFVLAGEIQVGNITISPDRGITIPLASGGEIRFPSDGSAAVIDAILRTDDLAVNGGLSINGISNYVRGVLHLGVGVDDPTTPPRLVWDYHRLRWRPSPGLTGGGNGCQGLARTADGSTWATVLRTAASSGTAGRPVTWANRRTLIDDTTGAVTYLPNVVNTEWRSVTAVGPRFYWLGLDNSTGYAVLERSEPDGNTFRVALRDTTGARIPLGTLDGALAADPAGDAIWLVKCDATWAILRYRYALRDTGALDGGNATTLDTSSQLYGTNITAHWIGTADFDGPRLAYMGGFVNHADASQLWGVDVTAADGTYLDADCWEFEMEVPNTSALWWDADAGRFLTAWVDAEGFYVAEFNTNTRHTATTAAYTWYDNNPAGGTHESAPSPSVRIGVPARSFLVWDVPPPPMASHGQDDPSAVRLYLNTDPEQPTRLLTTVDTGNAVRLVIGDLTGSGASPPQASSFPPDTSTGEVRDGVGNYWRGTGAFQLGSLHGTGDGSVAGAVPVGTIIMFGGTQAPWSWLICNGSTVRAADYPELAAVLGQTFGTGATGTVTLPDMRRRFPWGMAPDATIPIPLGRSDGLTLNVRDPAHKHSIDPPAGGNTWNTDNTGTNTVPRWGAYSGHDHGHSTGTTETPPNLALNFIIRAF